jgi:hypothetical protein
MMVRILSFTHTKGHRKKRDDDSFALLKKKKREKKEEREGGFSSFRPLPQLRPMVNTH